MFLNSLYYTLKPFIPRWLQIQIRRQIVSVKRKKYSHIWPIDEAAAKPPEGCYPQRTNATLEEFVPEVGW